MTTETRRPHPRLHPSLLALLTRDDQAIRDDRPDLYKALNDNTPDEPQLSPFRGIVIGLALVVPVYALLVGAMLVLS